jgi:hypothetical protein
MSTIFKNKQPKTASSISASIDQLTQTFTTVINGLNHTAQEADAIKTATEEQIRTMQIECDALQAASDRAKTLASKISDIFS